MSAAANSLPFGYYLDESDPDILIVRRPDGSVVAYFCATGATREGILKAIKDDCQKRSA